MSNFKRPLPNLVGRKIVMNSQDYPGAAYDATRRKGVVAVIVDAGAIGDNDVEVVLDNGVTLSPGFTDWEYL
jgi:hypothetical protein